jgi:hypothetical protein
VLLDQDVQKALKGVSGHVGNSRRSATVRERTYVSSLRDIRERDRRDSKFTGLPHLGLFLRSNTCIALPTTCNCLPL